MSNIKYISKDENYRSKDATKGIFPSPYLVPFAHSTNLQTKTTVINFKFCYLDNDEKEILIDNAQIVFTDTNTETIVDIGEGVEKEITQAILDGWTYDKDSVITWGYPDYLRVLGYFRLSEGTYKFPENAPFDQIAKDFIIQTVKIEGEVLGEGFELEIII